MSLKKYIRDWYRFLNPKYQNLFSEFPVDFIPRYNTAQGHAILYDLINKNRKEYSAFILEILKHKEVFKSWNDFTKESDHTKPCWNNEFFPALDMMALYTMIALKRPAKYVEIGSGNSTKVAYQAIRDNSLMTEITSIDPLPRASINELSKVIIREKLESIDLNVIYHLSEGDVLFIDNSHRILPNSDAMVVFMDILPRLSKGVIVHIHDIYLPYDYPQFMCDRFYSEQYGLAINIMANPKRYHAIFPCFFVYKDENLNNEIESLWQIPTLRNSERHGGSFWLRIAE